MAIRDSATDLVQRERLTLQLLKNWDSARRGRDLPAIGDFDFKILEGFGRSTFLLTIDGPDSMPVFRYVGRDLSHQVGRDLTGQPLSEAPRPSLLAQIAYQHLRVTAKRRPVALKGSYPGSPSATWTYQGLLLPFSENGDAVTTILGSFQCDSAEHHSGLSDKALDSEGHVTVAAVAAESSKAVASWIAARAGELIESSKATAGRIAAYSAGRASKVFAAVRRQRTPLTAARSRAVGPVGLDDRLKLLPPLGRVALALPSGSEFAFLLARRVDGDLTQYEVAEVKSPMTLLVFALHRCFRSAWWPLRRRAPVSRPGPGTAVLRVPPR